MSDVRIDPKKQFSKRLARWTAFFWFLFMTWLSVLLMLVPSAAEYTVYMAIICTVVMMVNVISYSANSITEKKIFGLLDKSKIEMSIGHSKISIGNNTEEDGGADEEVSNG